VSKDTPPTEFPRVLKACESVDRSQWALADAVLAEIGPPNRSRGHDGTLKTIELMSVWLAERGYEYTPSSLYSLRAVAFMFPKKERRVDMPFSCYRYLRSVKLMGEFMEQRAEGSRPTVSEVRGWRAKRDGTDEPPSPTKATPAVQFSQATEEATQAAKRALAIMQAHKGEVGDVEKLTNPVLHAWLRVRTKAGVKSTNGVREGVSS